MKWACSYRTLKTMSDVLLYSKSNRKPWRASKAAPGFSVEWMGVGGWRDWKGGKAEMSLAVAIFQMKVNGSLD